MNENPTKKKISRRALIIVAAVVAIFAIAAGIIIPVSINAASHSAAVSEYETAEKTLADAQGDVTDALDELAEGQTKAVALYAKGLALLNSVKGSETYFDSADTIAELEAALQVSAKAAGIGVAEDGTVTANAISFNEVVVKGAGLDESASTEGLTTATAELTKTVKSTKKLLTSIIERTETIVASDETLTEAMTAVVAAGEKSGVAWPRPAKTHDDAWNRYVTAVEAIKETNLTADSDLAMLTKEYIDARNGAQQSHNDQDAADRAAEQYYDSGDSYYDGESNDGSGGGGPNGFIPIPGGGNDPSGYCQWANCAGQ